MNANDNLRDASQRVQAELSKLEIPPPPHPPTNRRAFSFAIGMAVVLAVLGLAGLAMRFVGPGSEVGGDVTTVTSAPHVPDDQIYRGTVTVIDTGDNPLVCAGGVAESLPPQCSGPPIQGLDWTTVPWAETANGVTWAEMTIEVQLEDGEFTLHGVPVEAEGFPEVDVDFTPPCDPPPGGWVWTDGPLTTPEDMDNAITYANNQPDRTAVWVFNLLENPEESDLTGRQEYVVVALFTGDLESHEHEMRALWGGPLCVGPGTTNAEELLDIQNQLNEIANRGDLPGLVGFGYSYTDEIKGQVILGSLVVESSADEWAIENYGAGVIRFESQLKPVEK
jgi:hypothetical protein